MQLQRQERPLAVLSGSGSQMLWLHAAAISLCEKGMILYQCLAQRGSMT